MDIDWLELDDATEPATAAPRREAGPVTMECVLGSEKPLGDGDELDLASLHAELTRVTGW